MEIKMENQKLIIGDALALFIITVIGFVTHGEADLSFLPRLLAAFIPLTIGWFLLAPQFGLFEENIARKPNQLWRPVGCVLFAGPFAGVIRSIWLAAWTIPTSFVLAFTATSAVGMVLWRGVYMLILRSNDAKK
jgi:hypothetical protein